MRKSAYLFFWVQYYSLWIGWNGWDWNLLAFLSSLVAYFFSTVSKGDHQHLEWGVGFVRLSLLIVSPTAFLRSSGLRLNKATLVILAGWGILPRFVSSVPLSSDQLMSLKLSVSAGTDFSVCSSRWLIIGRWSFLLGVMQRLVRIANDESF